MKKHASTWEIESATYRQSLSGQSRYFGAVIAGFVLLHMEISLHFFDFMFEFLITFYDYIPAAFIEMIPDVPPKVIKYQVYFSFGLASVFLLLAGLLAMFLLRGRWQRYVLVLFSFMLLISVIIALFFVVITRNYVPGLVSTLLYGVPLCLLFFMRIARKRFAPFFVYIISAFVALIAYPALLFYAFDAGLRMAVWFCEPVL